MAERPRLAILASGGGTNAARLMDEFAAGRLGGDLVGLFSDKAGAGALSKARERGVLAAHVSRKGLTRVQHEDAMLAALAAVGAEHLLLAGYMRVLGPGFLRRFPGHVLNIHPSLLPEFPGLDAAAQQWEAGCRVVGATVHLVDEGVDTGPVLLQGSLELAGGEDAAEVKRRILEEVEHVIYPRAVRLFLERLTRGTVPDGRGRGSNPTSAAVGIG